MSSFMTFVYLLLMVFVQRSNCCCNVETGTTSPLMCHVQSSESTPCMMEITNDKLVCHGIQLELHGTFSLSHNISVECSASGKAIVRSNPMCHYPPLECTVSCENNDDTTGFLDTCSNNMSSITTSNVFTSTSTTPTQTTSRSTSSNSSQTTSHHLSITPVTSPQTNQPADTTSNMFESSTQPPGITPQTNIVNIVLILLSIIIFIMALLLCIIFASLITLRIRKRRKRSSRNEQDIVQENIYQTVGANRRPSRIIPIVTHGGQCLEMSEFPRYDNIVNHGKLSDMLPSKHCDKGGFPMDPVPMATNTNINGCLPGEEHHYSDIPAHKVNLDQNPLLKGYSPAPALCPQKGARLSTCSSQSSQTYEVINPYSTLDEARNQALLEIKSKHTEEHSDDILMLNTFGSDKPKWTHDTRPLKLSVPEANTHRPISGRMSLREEEDQYIEMGGDLEGGWGELQPYGSVFNRHQGTPKGRGGFCTFEKEQYIRQKPRDTQPLEEPDRNTNMNWNTPTIPDWTVEAAPPLPERDFDESQPVTDKSIEDLYARVRKKTGECSNSSDEDVIIVSDDDENTQPQDNASSPIIESMNATNKDNAMLWDITVPSQARVFGENVTDREHFNAQF